MDREYFDLPRCERHDRHRHRASVPWLPVTILLSMVASHVHADSLRCNGNLVSTGDSMQTVLQNCGEPAARDGDRWIYRVQNQDALSNIVTFSDGLVDSITAGNFPGFRNSPFDTRP